MERQRLFTVLVVILVAVGLFFFFGNGEEEMEIDVEEEQASVEDVTRELSSTLGVTVPEDVERVTLRDVSNEGATGLATRSFSDGQFTHSVLAALPELTAGSQYQGWLVRGSEGEEDYSVVSTGRLRSSKGGYLLEYSDTSDLRDHDQVWVTVETEIDETPETRVLEGSF